MSKHGMHRQCQETMPFNFFFFYKNVRPHSTAKRSSTHTHTHTLQGQSLQQATRLQIPDWPDNHAETEKGQGHCWKAFIHLKQDPAALEVGPDLFLAAGSLCIKKRM